MATPIVEQTPAVRKAQRVLAAEIGLFRDRLMRAGLLLTHHAVEEGLKTIGYEIAALEEGTWPESVWDALKKTEINSSAREPKRQKVPE